MDVKIVDYGQGFENFVDYEVTGLSEDQLKYIEDNLNENLAIDGDKLKIRMVFDDNLFPFQSDVAKFKIEDFIAREEIEMNVFLSSFLENL